MSKPMKILRKWKFIVIIILAVALLLVAKACGPQDELSSAEGAARSAVSPLTAVGNFFGNFFDFSTKNQLEQALEDANNELAELKAQSSIAQDVSAENERLRELLDLKESNAGSWNMVAASVSGREIDNWYERLLINKGSADGIEENMAVVNEDGLVGRTVNVTENTSEVLLIIDTMGSLGGMLQESQIPGVLEGIGGGKGLLTMSNLPFDANIQLNDVIVTSGEGGVFPAGLLVGTVVKVGDSVDGLSRQAVVEPFCDFNSIDTVLVMIPVETDENSADSSDSEQGGASDSNSEDTFSGSDTTDNTGDSSDTQTDNTDNSDETTDSSNGDSGGDE